MAWRTSGNSVAVVVLRPEAPGAEGESPESLPVDRIHRADAALRIVSLGRAHVGVMSSYVVVLWLCEASGMVALKGLLVFLTFACTIVAVAYLPWLASLERQLYEIRAELQRQRGAIEAAAQRGFPVRPPGLAPRACSSPR